MANRLPEFLVVQRNGQTATSEDLAPLSFAGYAHFTAMQVRGRQIRGLDLHLERLRSASLELFGRALPDDQVRSYLRMAIEAGPADVSLMATIYSPAGEFTVAGPDVEPEVLIRTGPAAAGPQGPLSLMTVKHERVLPAVKHVGEVAKTYFLRQAAAQGFDDAAFVDHLDRLSEGTIWNLAFWDGNAVVWPEADVLSGITMSILRRQLERLGVPQRVQEVRLADLSILSGAVVMNSWTPGVPVRQIGSTRLPDAPALLELLNRAYQAEPLTSP
ncbi:aminotransferase class IV family protein [Microvirga arabica]|uniref:aminotransferase class IV family protein n=1 Tax=Microvirga arabica TaxID=1128671 RepID=UPI00193969C8|nr:aminotransferase class IV family protein [Microvirga arabica]MBM1172513.1 aminotransferase class IV family protein [Microvirga arabica]